MAEHDNSYKLLFSHPQMVADLLRDFVKEDWVAQLDFSTLEKVNASFVSDDLRAREDDVIWRLRWGEEWIYVYILLEFQSTVDPFMALRMMAYVALLYQDLVRSQAITRAQKLPPVLPIVLYNGSSPWEAAQEVSELMMQVPGGLERYRPRSRYLLIDEGRFSEAELAPLQNLVAGLFRLENSRSAEDLQQVLIHLLEWLKAPEQAGVRRAFAVWIGRVLLPNRVRGVQIPEMQDLQEVKIMLTERVKEWTHDWKQAGIEEGLQQGLQQGVQQGMQQGVAAERKMLLRQIQRRFGESVASQAARPLENCQDFAQMEEIAEWIIDCPEGDSFLARLGGLTQ